MQLGVLTSSLHDVLDRVQTLQEFVAWFMIQKLLRSVQRAPLSLNQTLTLPFTLESFRITGHENPEGKVVCRDLNTNLNKLIQARGKHLCNNALSDENRWEGCNSCSTQPLQAGLQVDES